MSTEPQTQFALTEDGVSIAYWTFGEGKPFVLPPGGAGTPSLRVWRTSEGRRFVERLATHRMVVRYDSRGFGNSQAVIPDFSLDARVQDLAAVIRKLGVDDVNLCGYLDSGPAAIAYAAANPERVSRLVLWGCSLHETKIVSDEVMGILTELAKVDFELYREAFLAAAVRFLGRDDQAYEFARSLREVMTSVFSLTPQIDVSGDLGKITAPTLVLHRRGMKVPPMAEVQKIAAGIPNARLSLLEGDSSSPYVGETEAVLAAIDDFLGDGDSLAFKPADSAESASREGAIATGTAVILFTDIVSSTELTERMGDARFRDASRALDAALRTAIRDAGGAAIDGKLLGDGVLATFPSAAQAIDAARACVGAAKATQLLLHIGLHAGDVIREDNNVYGGAVNIASRICGLSAPGEILVSDVVRGMARSSAGVEFEDRGEQEMKGVGEPVRVYAVRGQA